MNIDNIVDNFKANKKKPDTNETTSRFCSISDQVQSKAVEMRLQGMRLVDISNELDISIGAINTYCIKSLGKEKHTEISNQIRKLNREELEKESVSRQAKIKDLLLKDKNLSNRKIAEILGVAGSTINRDVKKMIKSSVLIKNECCGVGLLSVEKADLVKQVKTLEDEKAFLEHQLNNAITEIQRLNKRFNK